MNGPSFGYGNAENSPNGGELHHWAKAFTTIHTKLLRTTITNMMGLVPLKRTIKFLFMTKNPYRVNNVHTRRIGP